MLTQTHKRGETEAHSKVCVEKEVECDLCKAMVKRLVSPCDTP